MKIVSISDLHGRIPKDNVPECDVLTISGDTCPTYNHELWFQRQWLESEFNDWLKKQPAKHIVGIAGNLDWVFQDILEKGSPEVKLSWTYLCDSGIVIDGVKFWGHPWSPMFCQWAFMKYNLNGKGELYEKSLTIPDDVNVLIIHSPPFGILDTVEGTDTLVNGKIVREYLGNKPLKKRINELKNLKLCVFGHIHSAHGRKVIGDTTFINALLLNEDYELVYEFEESVI